MEVTDKIWTQNVDILYQKNRVTEILPTNNMTLPEKLNSLMRLSILIGIGSVILFSDYKYLYIPMMMALIQIGTIHMEPTILDKSKTNNESGNESGNTEGFETIDFNNDDSIKLNIKPELKSNNVTSDKLCIKPSKDNPFMNAMIYDSRYKQPACSSINNEKVNNNIDEYFNENLFTNISDIYNKRSSQRQFFTMPYTTYPNDSGNFAKWLYGRPPTCKEGNGSQCIADNYERLQGGSYKLV